MSGLSCSAACAVFFARDRACQESCVRGHSEAAGGRAMAIKKGTLDELLSGRDPKQVFSKDGLRVLNAELDEHLDGEAATGKANHRNGYSKKTVLTGSAKLDLRIPRDRQGTFDPKLIARYQRRFPGFDEKIVSIARARRDPIPKCSAVSMG